MDSKLFFQHLYNELEENNSLYPYYKLNRGSIAQQQFRKAYYLQRLNYIDRHVDRSIHPAIWDCGCGFGSTCFYFAMNGIASRGTTIEFYIDQIETRKKYWNRFGNAELFEYAYENLFDNPPAEEKYDYIILQDTLHHIEPLDKALAIFYRSLKKGGKLILVEENGSSIIRSLILYLKRGNKRVIKIYDNILQKNILLGNENIRSEKKWLKAFANTPFQLDPESIQYFRFFMPFMFNSHNLEQKIEREQQYWVQKNFVKRYGFFGINMVFIK